MIPGIMAGQMRLAGGDPYWANVVSLLHFDGADGSTTIIDEKGLTWTVAGSAQIDTAQSVFGGASLLKSADSDYILLPPNVGMNFGTGDFTLEFWHRRAALGARTILGSGQGSYDPAASVTLFFNSTYPSAADGAITFVYSATPLAVIDSGAFTPAVGDFAHIAITCQSGTKRMFIDGQLTDSVTDSYPVDLSAGSGTFLGRSGWSSVGSSGHYDDFRVTKGVARYTANFIPPSAPFPNY